MWILNTEEEILSLSQVMFSAPKKKFKKAVTRNRLKRLMRESYRKNKHLLYDFLEEKNKNIHLSIVFTGSADISYAETEGKIILTLQRLIEEIKLSLAK
jgi:ribonuclease P protein component